MTKLSICFPGRSASARRAGVFACRGHRVHSDTLYFVYILASRPYGVLYVGMTSDLPGRAWEHRNRVMDGFAKRYWVNRLVWFESHLDPSEAAVRERAIKRWRRDWKIDLIESDNPTWRDLYDDVVRQHGFEP